MDIEKAVGMELSACWRKKQISHEPLGFDTRVYRTRVSVIDLLRVGR